jgi:lysozyme
MAEGVDLYQKYNKVSSWTAVRNAGITFAYVKLSDGMTTRDDGGYVAGGRGVGIAMGGYAYAQPGNPVGQANLLCDRAEATRATDLAPALDIEDNSSIHTWGTNEAVDFSCDYLQRIKARGHRACLYANNSMLKSILARVKIEVPDVIVWAARYGADPTVVHDVHQYTSSGAVAGISGAVDRNKGVVPRNGVPSNGGGGYIPSPITGTLMMTEDNMATLPASMDAGYEVLAVPPDANVKLVFASKTVIFGGHLYNWSPVAGQGTGGDPGQWRTEVQEGEAIAIPKGTSKVHIEYSCASPVSVFIQASV